MFHQITVVGNLGRDPEMRYTPEGKAVTTMNIASSNRKDETTWFRVSVWEKQAEACNQYLEKGSRVLVQGTLRANAQGTPNVYEKKDGSGWASSFEITASTVRFLSKKNEQAETGDDILDEDLVMPF